MAFDTSAFESLEALDQKRAGDETAALRDTKYGDPEALAKEKRSLAESFGFRPFHDPTIINEGSGNNEIVEGEGEHPEALFGELDEVSLGEGNKTSLSSTDTDTLPGDQASTETNEKVTNIPDEHPESPFIERLGNTLSLEMKKDWIVQLNEGKVFHDIIQESTLGDSLKSSITASWNAMNSPSGKEKMQADFQGDYGNKCEVALASDGEMSEGDQELIEQIGGNYMKGADTSPEGQEEALNMALSTTINKEVFGKQCDKQAMVYTKNMQRINNSTLPLKERLQACKKVKMYVNRDQGAKAEKYEDIADMIDAADMTAEYADIQKALKLAQAQNNPQDIQVVQENILEIIDEASELTGTPLGTFDIALETGKSESPTESFQTA